MLTEKTVVALKWAIKQAQEMAEDPRLGEIAHEYRIQAESLQTHLAELLGAQTSIINGVVITPVLAYQWLTGEDHALEGKLRELAYLYQGGIVPAADACKLCQGDGRIGDDICCCRCNGTGKEPINGNGQA